MINRVRVGVHARLSPRDAASRLQPLIRCWRSSGLISPRNDHSAVGDADHLVFRGKIICRADVPGGYRPGILLAVAYIGPIFLMGRFTPGFVGGRSPDDAPVLTPQDIASKTLPTLALIVIVVGGIYAGWMTPVEVGAVGSAVALMIALVRRCLNLRTFKEALIETGHITATLLFLITAASIYSRMLGIVGLPNELAEVLSSHHLEFVGVLVIWVLLMLFLGTLLDTASIILIVVPLILPIVELMSLILVWFGIITVVGAEIGLLTPALGISCFVIKTSLREHSIITLKDVFLGALPFAFVT